MAVGIATKPAVNRLDNYRIFGESLADIEESTPAWLWEGYVLLGKMNGLVGDADKGKSLLTLDIAARVTRGWPMPLQSGDAREHARRAAGTPGNVILVCSEDDAADTIRPRLRVAGGDVGRVLVMRHRVYQDDDGEPRREYLNLGSADGRDWLIRAIKELDARLVVVDPLGSFMGGSGKTDMNKEQDMRTALGEFSDMLAGTRCAFLAIRHRGKDTKREPMNRALGSQAVTAMFRSEWAVDVKPEDETRRILSRLKCNLAPSNTRSLEFHIEAENKVPFIVWDGTSEHTARSVAQGVAAQAQRESPRDSVLGYLRDSESGGLRLHEIIEGALADPAYPGTKNKGAIKNVVHEMVGHGLVCLKQPQSVYHLPGALPRGCYVPDSRLDGYGDDDEDDE